MTQKPDDLEAVRTIADTLAPFDAAEQERILRWAKERVGLPVSAGSESRVQPAPPVGVAAEPAAPPSSVPPNPQRSDIKTFMAEKRPSSDTEFAAAVAYFLRFEAPVPDRRESIGKDDLLEACRLVGRGRPARPAQTLVNAHVAGVLDKAERGQYSINTVGENLVAITLPSSDATSAKPRRKSPAKRKSKTAAKKTTAKKKSGTKKKSPATRRKK